MEHPETIEMETNNPDKELIKEFKEFHDLLNEFYLKIGYTSENKLILICYNIKLLDNIRYEAKISSINQLYELSSIFKPYSNLRDIYDLFIQFIENKKFEIKNENNLINLNLIATDVDSNTIKISIKLLDSKEEKKDEYLNILSKEILNIRKQKEELEEIKNEQNDFKKEIEELKNMI